MDGLQNYFIRCKGSETFLTKDGNQKIKVMIDDLESPDSVIVFEFSSKNYNSRLNLTRLEFLTLYKNRNKILNYINKKKEKMNRKYQILVVGNLKVQIGDLHDKVGIYLKKSNIEIRYQRETFDLLVHYKYYTIISMYNNLLSQVKLVARKLLDMYQITNANEHFGNRFEEKKTQLLKKLDQIIKLNNIQ